MYIHVGLDELRLLVKTELSLKVAAELCAYQAIPLDASQPHLNPRIARRERWKLCIVHDHTGALKRAGECADIGPKLDLTADLWAAQLLDGHGGPLQAGAEHLPSVRPEAAKDGPLEGLEARRERDGQRDGKRGG